MPVYSPVFTDTVSTETDGQAELTWVADYKLSRFTILVLIRADVEQCVIKIKFTQHISLEKKI